MSFFRNWEIPEPSDLASWMIYVGGLFMVGGEAVRTDLVWMAFWYGGEWTIGFAVLYYLCGWFRKRYR